ncbi:hypothetical protein, partial [Aquisphaera insulae]|uniref:hypothetical protein n=1 Tax=Aquisphaera insulae TaxID=2712864 RepID=UPI00196AFFD8
MLAVNWTGAGDGTSWLDPMNWDTRGLPGMSDDVIIDSSSDPTVNIGSGDVAIRSLSLRGNDRLVLAGTSFATTTGLVVDSATLEFDAGTIGGTTYLYGSSLVIGPSSQGAADFVLRGANALYGDVANAQS